MDTRRTSADYKWTGAKFVFACLGLVCVYLGGNGLLTHLQHGWNGTSVTAIYHGQRTACRLEYMLATDSRWQETEMDCDEASAIVSKNPKKKVRFHSDTFVQLSYALPDGTAHDAEIKRELGVILPAGIQIGDRLPVVYAPENPGDVRTPFTLAALGQYLVMMGFGLFVLMLVFMRVVVRVVARAWQPGTPEQPDEPAPLPSSDRLAAITGTPRLPVGSAASTLSPSKSGPVSAARGLSSQAPVRSFGKASQTGGRQLTPRAR